MKYWWKPCEHGVYVGEHSTENWVWGATYWEPGKYVLDEASVCPGGSSVTIADLEGEKVQLCTNHNALRREDEYPGDMTCEVGFLLASRERPYQCVFVEWLLIPIFDSREVGT